MIASLLVLVVASAPPSSTRAGAPPVGAAAPTDVEAPIIEDVAAAASNPDAQPVITVMMSDRGTGVGTAFVVFRPASHEPWTRAELRGGTSGLFIARLPDGLQKSGFDYYIEATDVAGNGPARIGSPEVPIRVERATVATITRIAEQKIVEPGPAIHPGWLMLSLGTGVLAGAGAGAYAIDLNGLNNKIGDVDEALAGTDLTDDQRARLAARRDALETAALQDTVMATVLGVVGAAGIITGTTLVVLSSLE